MTLAKKLDDCQYKIEYGEERCFVCEGYGHDDEDACPVCHGAGTLDTVELLGLLDSEWKDDAASALGLSSNELTGWNVRELANALSRAVSAGRGEIIIDTCLEVTE